MTISKYSAKQNSKSIQTGDTNQLGKTSRTDQTAPIVLAKRPRFTRLPSSHFERWLKAQKDDREPWQAPFFEAYYRSKDRSMSNTSAHV